MKIYGKRFNFKPLYGLTGISVASHDNLFGKQRRHNVPPFLPILETETKTLSD